MRSINLTFLNDHLQCRVSGCSARINEDKGSIYIFFQEKPADEIRDALKKRRWRYSSLQNCWFIYDTDENREFAEEIVGVQFNGRKEISSDDAEDEYAGDTEITCFDTLVRQQDNVYVLNKDKIIPAVVLCILESGLEEKTVVTVKCDSEEDHQYYISENDFEELPGKPFCRVLDRTSEGHQQSSYYDRWKEHSILREYGYTVNQNDNMPDAQRHKILELVIDSGVQTPQEVVEFIGFLAQRNVSEKYYQAIQKWKTDIDFVHKQYADFLKSKGSKAKRI